jgi:hypothetical protein
MKQILPCVLFLLALGSISGAQEAREFNYFRPIERNRPLTLPAYYSLSKFGRGLYRIDTIEFSRGRLNCLFLTFTATPPEGTSASATLTWKTERTEAEGQSIIRLSAVLANPFAREPGAEGDVLTVRIDALDETVAARLRTIAEGILPR